MKDLSPRTDNKQDFSRRRGERGNANIIAAVVIALLFVVLLFGRKLGLPSDLLSLLHSQPTIRIEADAWKMLSSPESGFSVEMPGAPESSTGSGEIDGRTLAMRLYRIQNEAKYQFNVSVLDVRELIQNQGLDPEAVLGAYVQGLVKNATGKLVSEKPARLDIFSGREILVESDGAMSRVRIYLKDAYLYSVEARSTRKFVTSADAGRFFASFKFTANAPSGAPVAPGWTEFSPIGGRFSIQMPGLPRSEQQDFRTKGGDMVLFLFNLDRGGDNERFSAQYTDYPEEFLKETGSADAVLKKASTVDAFNIGGRVVSEKALSLGRHPGRELHVENAEQSMRIRLYLVDRRLYKVVAAWPKSRAFSVDADLYLNSFRLVN